MKPVGVRLMKHPPALTPAEGIDSIESIPPPSQVPFTGDQDSDVNPDRHQDRDYPTVNRVTAAVDTLNISANLLSASTSPLPPGKLLYNSLSGLTI